MFFLTQPSERQIQHFLELQRALTFSYKNVGSTHPHHFAPPTTFTHDHNRILLGKGQATFEKAKAALKNWQAYALGWTQLYPNAEPREGLTACVMVKHFGFYSLSSLRVVYVVDELSCFAYAIGTLPGHVEKGEERFMLEWLPDDSVWYDLFAFSRPQHFLAWMGCSTLLAKELCQSL
jgi:uncharacterized protein (UPF0548 family)